MIGKGEFEVDVNGVMVGFKFGMYASGITEKESGLNIGEFFGKFQGQVSIEMLLYYFYGGHVAYCKLKNLQPQNIVVFGDTLEDIGLEKLLSIYSESLGVYSKNGQAPKESGQPSTV
jgi:hypothetical protein